jgi:hypothetical protein
MDIRSGVKGHSSWGTVKGLWLELVGSPFFGPPEMGVPCALRLRVRR